MKKVVLVYGLIAGAIVAAMMFITIPMYDSGQLNHDNGELIGYTTMTVALSMIFFGVKSYRDNYSGGTVSFWKAIKIGLMITAVAAIMYATAWEFVYPNMSKEFMDGMLQGQIDELRTEGATTAKIEETRAEWTRIMELYKNPAIRFAMTIMEVLPVGLILTLLSAGLLRNKNFLRAQSKTGGSADRQLA
jgi:hypothetical protein